MVETMEIQKGFKQSEVGVIPSDWKVQKLTNIAEICTGSTPPTSDPNNYGDDYYFVSPADLGKGRIILNTEKKLSLKGFNLSRKYPKNSILFTCIGSTIGKSGIADIELTSNQQINAIFPNNTFDSDYLYYLLNLLANKIKQSAGETAVPIINKTEFGELSFPLPPTKAEQTAIATALNDADALITQLEKLIAKKRAIKQGAMQELLKPKEGWDWTTVGKLGKPYGGLSSKSKSDFKDGNCPYIPFMNIMSNPIIDKGYLDYVKINSTENQNKAQRGDLFFNGSSETPEEVGMCSVLLNDISNLYLNSFCFGLRLNKEIKTDGLYLAYFFRSNYGRKIFYILAQGATRHNLSKSNFIKIELQIPKHDEQTRIAGIIRDMDNEIFSLEKKLEKYKMIKQGMMQNLLTGRIRLV